MIRRSDINGLVEKINLVLIERGGQRLLSAEWAYGKPRVYIRDKEGRLEKELSPRLSTGPMMDWLRAFSEGLYMGMGF